LTIVRDIHTIQNAFSGSVENGNRTRVIDALTKIKREDAPNASGGKKAISVVARSDRENTEHITLLEWM
tara:strand:- start:253 stop:459 length:207 start_codon:yes stop_codon:yes gene_type:complete